MKMVTTKLQLTVTDFDRIYNQSVRFYKQSRKEIKQHWYERHHVYGKCLKPGFGSTTTKDGTGFSGAAQNAWEEAKNRALFEMAERDGLVRITMEADKFFSVEDLEGDCFDPAVNSDVKPELLAEERQYFFDRIEHDGVWGAVLSCRHTDGTWDDHVDSIWGFVGDDFIGSGHDADFHSTAVEWVRKNYPGYYEGLAVVFITSNLEEAA